MKDRVGEKHITNEGYIVKICEYYRANNVTIEFDNGLKIFNRAYDSIRIGSIKNPYHKSVLGIGYIGVGDYCSKNKKIMSTWKSLIKRCGCNTYKNNNPTYSDVTVCDDWYNFQNFAKWYEDNYKYKTMYDWSLDKDILIKGNKVYSPETCCFVPKQINTLFVKCDSTRGKYLIGVRKRNKVFSVNLSIFGKVVFLGQYPTELEAFEAYKTAKERHIKNVADKWKSLIDPKVYTAMYKYVVEITD
jgi:hypothetical protein